MREIKFRAWKASENLMINVAELVWCVGGLKWSGPGVGEGIVGANPKYDWSVDTILMQYTGLRDKNGKEIYEGDVVEGREYRAGSDLMRWTVQWDTPNAYWFPFGTGFSCDDCYGGPYGYQGDGTYQVQIIGNIYENPELLEAK